MADGIVSLEDEIKRRSVEKLKTETEILYGTEITNRLLELNEQYSWDSVAGRVLQFDGMVRHQVTSFHNRWDNERYSAPGQKGSTSISSMWMRWKGRRTHDRIGLWPPPEVAPKGAYNLWGGWAIEPSTGDWSVMRDHMLEVLCDGKSELYDDLVKWCAWVIQNPGALPQKVLILKGVEGAGKGQFMAMFERAFGHHYQHITSPEKLVGRFNGWLENCLFLFADEAYFAGDKSTEGTLKGMVTERDLVLERKGLDSRTVKNRLAISMATNNRWAVPAGEQARRFFVLDVSSKRVGDKEYFDRFSTPGLAEAFLGAMLSLDLGEWHPRMMHATEALREQQILSLRGAPAYVYQMLVDGELPGPWAEQGLAVAGEMVYSIMCADRYSSKQAIARDLGRELRALGAKPDRAGVGTAQRRVWRLPSLHEARKAWEKAHWAEEWPFEVSWSRSTSETERP